jgi:dTDP-4-dehydrorhamnose 3,5-epimerase
MDKKQQLIEGIEVTNLKIVPNDKGEIYHGLKSSDICFNGFGEAYFTTINKGFVKGWKKHNSMISNLLVPTGIIRLVFYDDRINSSTKNNANIFELSNLNYKRITVNPGIWFAFEGLGEFNLLLNISNIVHDPNESDNIALDNSSFNYYNLTKL